MTSRASQGLRVAIFGATGMAGRGVLQACIEEPRVLELRAIVRRPLGIEDERLHEIHCDDFSAPSPIASAFDGLDAVLWCLGISASKVDGEAQYRVITFDYALAAARLLAQHSPSATLHFISGAGTNVGSRMMWARVKGETEAALGQVGLGGLVCWRPGMILADRSSAPMSLPWRVLHGAIGRVKVLPSVSATELGHAMLQATFDGLREGTLENREIRAMAQRYGARSSA